MTGGHSADRVLIDNISYAGITLFFLIHKCSSDTEDYVIFY